MVPSGVVTHIAYHFPELEEIVGSFGRAASEEHAPIISVQEHLIIEEYIEDDDYSVDGSFPIETFKVLRQSGTIHHETEGGGSIEVCIEYDNADIFPVLVALDITTGRNHKDSDAGEVEDELEHYMDQIEDAQSGVEKIMNEARSIQNFEVQFHSSTLKMHKTSLRWPLIQIIVLSLAGIVWCYSIQQYLKKRMF